VENWSFSLRFGSEEHSEFCLPPSVTGSPGIDVSWRRRLSVAPRAPAAPFPPVGFFGKLLSPPKFSFLGYPPEGEITFFLPLFSPSVPPPVTPPDFPGKLEVPGGLIPFPQLDLAFVVDDQTSDGVCPFFSLTNSRFRSVDFSRSRFSWSWRVFSEGPPQRFSPPGPSTKWVIFSRLLLRDAISPLCDRFFLPPPKRFPEDAPPQTT